MDRTKFITRAFKSDLKVREEVEQEEKVIEGYFVIFNSETELWPGAFEEIATGAFDETMDNDIRALINHDTKLVLARTKSGTLTLTIDDKGLYGRIVINEQDVDAMSLYARVQRGDVDQCSFGFNILEESVDYREDGSVKWNIVKVDLHEVSVVTFPAYEDTGVQARKRDFEDIKGRSLQSRKNALKEKLQHAKTTYVAS